MTGYPRLSVVFATQNPTSTFVRLERGVLSPSILTAEIPAAYQNDLTALRSFLAERDELRYLRSFCFYKQGSVTVSSEIYRGEKRDVSPIYYIAYSEKEADVLKKHMGAVNSKAYVLDFKDFHVLAECGHSPSQNDVLARPAPQVA